MAPRLGRLLSRLPSSRRAPAAEPAASSAPEPIGSLDDREVGLPILRPAAIIRQVLFEATEFTPAWALPRPTTTAAVAATLSLSAEPAPPVKPARRRTSATSTGGAPKKPATSRRTKASRT